MARKAERLLSIIVPVYNVEEYLAECIESILACRSFSYELLLVLKESKDQSLMIAKKYARQHVDVIRILHQRGDGLSNARNQGLEEARGEYVAFFDSDDMIQGELFSQLIAQLSSLREEERPEVILSDYTVVGREGKVVAVHHSIEDRGLINDSKYMDTFLSRRRNYWNAWQYVFHRMFLIQNGLFYMEGVYSEDMEHSTRVLLQSQLFAFSHAPYYCYRIGREGSLVNGVTLKHIQDLMGILKISVERVRKKKNLSFGRLIEKKLRVQYFLSFAMLFDTEKQDRRKAMEMFCQNAEIFFQNRLFRAILSRKIVVKCIAVVLVAVRLLRRKILNIH